LSINKENIQLLELTRKELHSNPEISGKEFNTQKRILNFLENHNIKAVKIGKTGVLVEFNSNTSSKSILIRADIDALPIQEKNQFKHKSKINGISHKCGHDGHTSILLGLAIQLTKTPIQKGKVFLLFQPSEENGKGAKAVLNDSTFNKLKIDYAFALHNLPGFPLHEIVIKENEFTSNVKSVIIKLNGKTAHAAEPEKGYNPANAIAAIIDQVSKSNNNNPSSKDFFLITPIHINMGEVAYGISAGYGEVHFTIRSWSTELMEKECIALESYISNLCKQEKLTFETTWLEEFYSNNNDKIAVKIIKEAAIKNDLSINDILTPFKWGEDFGLFTQRFKGAMFGLGAGIKTPPLHNPDYDFPDEITSTGIDMFNEIIKKTLEY
jgi:amidohydrolase